MTRLLSECGRRAAKGGFFALDGECREDLRRPLQPLLRPLRRLSDHCRTFGEGETDRILGSRGPILAAYEPALALLPGQAELPLPAEVSPEQARARVLEALLESLLSWSCGESILLILDDLQWADDLTLEFVQRVSRRGTAESGQLFVLGAYRTEEPHGALRALIDGQHSAELQLSPLLRASVAAIVGEMLALEVVPPELLGFLDDQSEGNPFFVAEYLRSAVEQKLLLREVSGHWQLAGRDLTEPRKLELEQLPLPRSLKDVLDRRLGALSTPALRLVQAAAVAGREAFAALVARAAELPQQELFQAIAEVELRQILYEVDGGRLRFQHDKLRESALAALSPARRRALHRSVAMSLESLPEAEREELHPEMAHHWEQAGEPDTGPSSLPPGGRAGLPPLHSRRGRALLPAFPQAGHHTGRGRCFWPGTSWGSCSGSIKPDWTRLNRPTSRPPTSLRRWANGDSKLGPAPWRRWCTGDGEI